MTQPTADETIKLAVLTAARTHAPDMHERAVRWDHEPEPATDLQVEISTLSLVDLLATPKQLGPLDEACRATMLDWQVQLKFSAASAEQFSKAYRLAMAVRLALHGFAVREVLEAGCSDIVPPLGNIKGIRRVQAGRAALDWIYEATFRVPSTWDETEAGGVIERVIGDGDIDIGTTIETSFDVEAS